ncbi:MAG: type II toxin-antitoxin system VapC family toxin [Hadesarchaea archaeon]|nr:type II toxin-antitoxin system VapC family toxin [Hadesarchaea archaeon]
MLDTNAVVALLKEKKHEPGAISVLTLIEVMRGLATEKRALAKKLLEESFSVINLDNEVIEAYCSLYRELKRRGTPLPDADLLIAATAMSRDLALETGDRHIKRLEEFGLKLAEPKR